MRGATVVMLDVAGPLAGSLAERFHVVPCEAGDFSKGAITAIKGALPSSGSEGYSLIAASHSAADALSHAIDAGLSLRALVLLAPSYDPEVDDLALALEQVQAPTLVLSGTLDQTVPKIARQYARRIPKCFYALVYDAGADIQADRPGALHNIVSDFLERGEKFVVPDTSTAINP